MTRNFEEAAPGIWTGPTEHIATDDGDVVIVGTMWTDEDGVQVTLNTPEEGMIPATIAGKVAEVLARFGRIVPAAAAA